MWTQMLTAVLFTIAKKWKSSQCSSTNEWTTKCLYPYNEILFCYKKEVLTHTATWINPENIMPSGRSQTQKAMCRMSLWNAQNGRSSRQKQASGLRRGQWRTTVQQVLSCLWGQGTRPSVWRWGWLRSTGKALSHWIVPWSVLPSTKKREAALAILILDALQDALFSEKSIAWDCEWYDLP